FFHVVADAGKALEIFLDVGARLFALDAELVGEPEGGDAVDDAEVDGLGAAANFPRHALDRHAEHFRGRHGVNVETLAEGLLQRLDAGDLGQEPQLDLGIIGGDELVSVGRDESAPDLAAFLGADRNVLQVGLGGGEAAGGSRGERVARVDAVRAGVDVTWQRVGIGRFELRNLSPVENFPWQRVALLGQVLQGPGPGRPLAGLGLGTAGKSKLAEQNIAELFRAARIERLAGERPDFALALTRALRDFTRQPREHLPIDRDPAPLHAREHRNDGPLQRLVDAAHALAGDARLEQLP